MKVDQPRRVTQPLALSSQSSLDLVLHVLKRALDEAQNLRETNHRLSRQAGHIYRLAKREYVATVLEGLNRVLDDVRSVRPGRGAGRSWVLAGG